MDMEIDIDTSDDTDCCMSDVAEENESRLRMGCNDVTCAFDGEGDGDGEAAAMAASAALS
jgi:hypothetical protein